MRQQMTCKRVSVLMVLPVLFFLCLVAPPLMAADEETPKEVITEELPPGETEGFADRLFFIADFSAFLTHSDLSGSSGTQGGSVNALIAPVYPFNDTTFFILMYDGWYYKKREFYSDDVGPRQRNEFQSHTLEPMVRFDFGDRTQYSLTPSVFHTRTYNTDVDTDGWDDGLYNYEDWGAGLDFDWRGVYGEPGTVSVGLEYYSRDYPNYVSLLTRLDTSAGNNREEFEKDYTGIITKVGYSWAQALGWSWDAGYSLLYKNLDDKKVVGTEGAWEGVLTDEEQEDWVHSVDVGLKYVFDIGGGLQLGADLNGTWYDSNQNYYDGMATATPADNVPIADYYDYFSYRIRPNISYTFALYPFTPSLSYAYYKIEYDERNARAAGGIYPYKNDRHYEEQDEFVLGLRYDLTNNWSILGQWQNITQRSNNEDERTYRYSYTINNYSIGVSFKY